MFPAYYLRVLSTVQKEPERSPSHRIEETVLGIGRLSVDQFMHEKTTEAGKEPPERSK